MHLLILEIRHPIIWSNALWFTILAVLSIILIAYTFIRKRDMKLLVFFFWLGGIAGVFENVICIYLQSYTYYPKVLGYPYYDSMLGAFLSQVFYVSSVALFVAAFRLKFRWNLAFSLLFVGIEYLFLAVDIYKLNWWRPYYTLAGLICYFALGKKWLELLQRDYTSRLVRWLTQYGATYIVTGDLVAIPFFSGHYHFTFGWFDIPGRNSAAVLVLLLMIQTLIFTLLCVYNVHWLFQLLAVISVGIGDYVLAHLHVLSFKYIWEGYWYFLSGIIALLCCTYFNRVLLVESAHSDRWRRILSAK